MVKIIADPIDKYIAQTNIKTLLPNIKSFLDKNYGVVSSKFTEINELASFIFVLKRKPDTDEIGGIFNHTLKVTGLAGIVAVKWDNESKTLTMSCKPTKKPNKIESALHELIK